MDNDVLELQVEFKGEENGDTENVDEEEEA